MSSETPEKNPPTRPAPPTTLRMNTEAATQEEEFVKTYREAYKYIDHGITLATQNMHTQVSGMGYLLGLDV